LWKGFDLGFVDGIVNGIGHFVIETGIAGQADTGWFCPQLRGDHLTRSTGGHWILHLLRDETRRLVDAGNEQRTTNYF
jgi:hypothetical protein